MDHLEHRMKYGINQKQIMIIISLPNILDGKKNGRNIRGRSKSKIDVQKYIVSEGTRELKKREE